jgi:murein L,D-transpeptidase YcbB/YkuD
MDMRSSVLIRTALCCGLMLSCAACQESDRPSPVVTAITQQVGGERPAAVAEPLWNDAAAFYAARGSRPAWIDVGDVSRARRVIEALNAAATHGLEPEDYDAAALEQEIGAFETLDQDTTDGPARAAALDTGLTLALLHLGRDVAVGRTSPTALDAAWKTERTAPDFAGTLSAYVENPVAWLEAVQPPHPEYAALRKALENLRGQRANGPWPEVPDRAFTRGESDPAVTTLRRRLAAEGYLAGEAATSDSPRYGEDIDTAVRAFQEHHAIKATGLAASRTLAAMSVPLDARIQQVATNMERWRWAADDLGERHLLVNIPAFHLFAREHGETVMDIRVVVGKEGHETPVFSGSMQTVVFSPYWNIPDSIAEGETAPAAAQDPEYLARNHIEILRVSKDGTSRIDPSDVDWDDPEELESFAFRQLPGDHNALGHVKFLFPNTFDVYLHDTPADSLFARQGRAFSHGCVRVEEPEALAAYVLRGDDRWDEQAIRKAMYSGVEQPVTLREEIPVHIVYFTTWVDPAGGLHFYPDVYGYDSSQQRERD